MTKKLSRETKTKKKTDFSSDFSEEIVVRCTKEKSLSDTKETHRTLLVSSSSSSLIGVVVYYAVKKKIKMADQTPPVLSGTLTKRGGKDLYGKNTWRLRHFQLHLASEKKISFITSNGLMTRRKKTRTRRKREELLIKRKSRR